MRQAPHLTLKLYGCDPSKLWNKDLAYDCIMRIVEAAEMNLLDGPYICQQEEDIMDMGGITGTAVISTSHIAFHSFPQDAERKMYWEVFSCKFLDENEVVKILREAYEPGSILINITDRNVDGTYLIFNPPAS